MRRLFAVIMCSWLLMACGTSSGDSGTEPDAGEGIQPFDVVPLHPDVGDDAEANIGGARISAGGSLQILVEGGRCSVPTRLHLNESRDSVVVSAFAATIHRGPCPLDIVPWFVEVPLSVPLGSRQLLSGLDNSAIRLVDCSRNSEHLWCQSL
jgi:hypothetical protein